MAPPHALAGRDLASHGYVAAGIDHTYESYATAFPDGRVTTCLAREARQRGRREKEKVTAGRAADVSFVLGELTGGSPAWPGAALQGSVWWVSAGQRVFVCEDFTFGADLGKREPCGGLPTG